MVRQCWKLLENYEVTVEKLLEACIETAKVEFC